MPSPAIFFTSQAIKIFKSPAPAALTYDLTCNIYPLFCLGALIKKLKEQPSPLRTIRYLVDPSKHIWFAEEGAPSKSVPAHCRMTGKKPERTSCIAAGNIEFSADFTEIIMVNNKSGDFKPNFDSIKWPLAILAANQKCLEDSGIHLSNDIRVEQLTAGVCFQDLHFFSKEELTTWAHSFSSEEFKQLIEQPFEIKQVSYQIPVATSLNQHGIHKRSINHDEDEDEDEDDSDTEIIEFNPY